MIALNEHCPVLSQTAPDPADGIKEIVVTKITYHIVKHDGGWAYRLGDVFSEAFGTHDAALAAARRAAIEQQRPGETTGISWEDDRGRWHEEVSEGNDRPITDVQG